MTKRVIGGFLVVAVALVGAVTARGDSPGVTRGDAQAVFEAVFNGGFSSPSPNSPGNESVVDLVRINPVGPHDFGRHYCSTDWHAIFVSLFDWTDPDLNLPHDLTHAQIARDFAADDVVFTLDGSELGGMTRTGIKPLDREFAPNFGVSRGVYWINVGEVIAPQALSVGTHTLSAHIILPKDLLDETVSIDFFVDPPNTGACLP